MTPEQMKALMAYVIDTAAAVQDYRLHGKIAARSRDTMLAAFGFRLEDNRFENSNLVRVEQPAQEMPDVIRAREIAICKGCGQYFHMPTGHDCPGFQPREAPMGEIDKAAKLQGFWRKEYEEMSDARLREIAADEGERLLRRDLASAVLQERLVAPADGAPTIADAQYLAEAEARAAAAQREAEAVAAHAAELERLRAEAEAAAAERQAERERAAAIVDDTPAPAKASPVASSENHEAALAFCQRLTAADLVTGVQQSQYVQGRPVKDGWTVNVRDEDNEIGFVAAWWGRAHFLAYVEIAGHRERTHEAADLLLALLHRAREIESDRGE